MENEKKPESTPNSGGLFGKLLNRTKGADSKKPVVPDTASTANAFTQLQNRVGESNTADSLAKKIINQSQTESGEAALGSVIRRRNEEQMFWGQVALTVAVVFLILTGAFYLAFVHEANYIFHNIGMPEQNFTIKEQNTAKDLRTAKDKLAKAEAELEKLEKQGGSDANEYLVALRDREVLWSEQIDNINKIILKVSPYNPVTKRFTLDKYDLSTADKEITIGGMVQNPGADTVYTLLANFVDAVDESPYFFGLIYDKYGATSENASTTGNFNSTLAMTFMIQEDTDAKDNPNFEETNYSNLPSGRRYRNSGFRVVSVNELNGETEVVTTPLEGEGEEGVENLAGENAEEITEGEIETEIEGEGEESPTEPEVPLSEEAQSILDIREETQNLQEPTL